jgi:hypothetical protein
MSQSPPDHEDDPARCSARPAHEIKNALGPLAMTLQLAERQLLAGQPIQPPDIAFARAQVRRLSRWSTTDGSDARRSRPARDPPADTDLRAVVTETVETFRRGHAAPVTVEPPPGGALAVSIDETRIHQVCSTCSRTPRAIPPTARRSAWRSRRPPRRSPASPCAIADRG